MIKIFCDGGARGNPGPAAYGFVVYLDDKLIQKGAGYLGIATNNFAEYTAVIKALARLKNHYQGSDMQFYLDSQLVVLQLSGIYKVKNAQIRELVFRVRTLENSFRAITYRHIPRERNKEADALVNLALDKQLKLT